MSASISPGRSLTELRQNELKVFRRGSGSRPDVLLVDIDGFQAVLKDHNACDPWFARILGPLLAAREARALSRLHDMNGVPELLQRPDARSLLLQYLPVSQLSDRRNEHTNWVKFFERLQALLTEMHERGVAHCDLRSPFNTLIDDNGKPVVVDFVASVTKGRPWNFPANWVFNRFVEVDKTALIKLKKAVAPELISDHENERFSSSTNLEHLARWFGTQVRSLSRKLFTQK